MVSKTSDTNKIPYVLSAADTFLKTAEEPYQQLSKRWKARLSGGEDELVSNPGQLAPLVSNVAFGIELLLKVLRIQDNSLAPRGHKLTDLFKPLDSSIQHSLEKRYIYHLEKAQETGGAPDVLFRLSAVEPNFETSPAKTIQIALKNMNKAFEEWRYLYELEDLSSGILYFNFFESVAVAKSLRDEISEFKGGAIVKFERTP